MRLVVYIEDDEISSCALAGFEALRPVDILSPTWQCWLVAECLSALKLGVVAVAAAYGGILNLYNISFEQLHES